MRAVAIAAVVVAVVSFVVAVVALSLLLTEPWARNEQKAGTWNVSFGGSVNTQLTTFLALNSTASNSTNEKGNVRNNYYNPQECYIVGATAVRENINSKTSFLVEIEDGESTNVFPQESLMTFTLSPPSQVAKSWFKNPLFVGTNCRVRVVTSSLSANPKNCQITLIMSYSNDSFVAPDREGDEDDNAVVTNMAGDEPPLQERMIFLHQQLSALLVDQAHQVFEVLHS